MYEGSVGVPFIISCPDIPQNKRIEENISLIDCFPTIMDAVGACLSEEDKKLPGNSLLSVAKGDISRDRSVFSEYHAAGFRTASYMVRKRQYKYISYMGYESQLFDLKNDPDELNDLIHDPKYSGVVQDCEKELHGWVNPEKINQKALDDQELRIEENGGRKKILEDGFKIPFSPVPERFR
jgi:choline-sulfatase